MIEALHQWLFFFLVVGPVVFFAIRFSRLARAHGKNKWIFGFVGAACFPGAIRLVALLTNVLNFNPEHHPYIFSYSMVMLSFLIAYGVYYLLKRNWGSAARP